MSNNGLGMEDAKYNRLIEKLEALCTAMETALIDVSAERDALRAALKPFCFGDATMEEILFGHLPDSETATFTIKLGDIRRARRAIDASPAQ